MAQVKLNAALGLEGTLPAVSGANLTSLNASNISSGTLNSARFSGGKIGQIIQGTRRGEVTTTSDSFTAFTELSASITPTATSSKVLVEMEVHCHTAAGKAAYMDIQRAISGGATTQLGITADGSATQGFSYRIGFANTTTVNGLGYLRIPVTWLDSPSTVSACTYCPIGKTEINGQTSYWFNNGNISTITLSEVLA